MAARRSLWRVFVRRYLIAFVTATSLMAVGVFAVNYVIDRKLDNVERVKVDTAPEPPEGANYLLIGSDTRAFVDNPDAINAFGDPTEETHELSDTMMVLHVEPNAQRTLMVSFPRDLLVNVPGIGRTKINAAFNSENGPDRVIQTLNENFGIEINHYLEVDFKSFEGIVGAIGNVPVYFPYPARDEKSGLYIDLPGCLKLDGPTALAYVRSRSLEYFSAPRNRWLDASGQADLDRIKRQQSFIRTLAGIAVQKSLSNPLTGNDVADNVLENLKIDQSLSKDAILALIDAFRTVNPNDTSSLEFQTFPNSEAGDGANLLPKQPEAQAMADRLMDFSGNQESAPPASVTPAAVKLNVLNGSGRSGLAKSALDLLAKQGFTAGTAGNDPRGEVTTTEVRYKPGAQDKGKLVLTYLKPAARLVPDSSIKGADVAVVLGTDFLSVVIPTATPGAPPLDPTAAPAPAPTDPIEIPLPSESIFGPPAPKKAPCR